jgi:hypothetical protein
VLSHLVGPGTGSFTLGVGQVHMMTQLSLKKKESVMIGEGSGVYNSDPSVSQMYAEL